VPIKAVPDCSFMPLFMDCFFKCVHQPFVIENFNVTIFNVLSHVLGTLDLWLIILNFKEMPAWLSCRRPRWK
jgi:hypothetical protein